MGARLVPLWALLAAFGDLALDSALGALWILDFLISEIPWVWHMGRGVISSPSLVKFDESGLDHGKNGSAWGSGESGGTAHVVSSGGTPDPANGKMA
eukprot:CAMPEP_0115890930 /NCGR_PEP_ID=MMETSP0287-20121206/33603_1 /TAXON_ID=412157 /ORGANISM="Chrysochromulina rotalis, Strain UIO044" /LENGTH=96 /DNA_ID=CAMNT_0003347713 /DNA_START=480 /DNA_END=770 /DNA_ORIENTATION=-